jgi:hypothetical protein
MLIVGNDIFGWACLQANYLLEKGRDRPVQYWEARLHGDRKY